MGILMITGIIWPRKQLTDKRNINNFWIEVSTFILLVSEHQGAISAVDEAI